MRRGQRVEARLRPSQPEPKQMLRVDCLPAVLLEQLGTGISPESPKWAYGTTLLAGNTGSLIRIVEHRSCTPTLSEPLHHEATFTS